MKKNVKIVILVIAIILLIGGFVYFMRNRTLDLINDVDIKESTLEEKQIEDSTKVINNEVTCNIGYEITNESKVVFDQSNTLITNFEKKCDGNYYLTFDYLGVGTGQPESGNGSFYSNTNLKLRTFKVDSNIKVKTTQNEEVSFLEYVKSFKKAEGKIFNQNDVYYGLTGQPVFNISIQNGVVGSINEVYLP